MKTFPRPWFRDFLAIPIPALLSREAFVAAYLPQYVRDYSTPTGIRLNARGRCIMSTAGSYRAQVSKRENRIDEQFAAYQADHAASVQFDQLQA